LIVPSRRSIDAVQPARHLDSRASSHSSALIPSPTPLRLDGAIFRWQNSVANDGTQSKYDRKGILRVGDLMLRVRGMSRFDAFEANDLTLKRIRKGDGKKLAVWEASITLRVSESDCARERTGHDIACFDQGLTDRLVFDNGEKVENTRLLRNRLDELAELQQARSRCTKGSRQYQRLNVLR
jgi:hypothetical protein